MSGYSCRAAARPARTPAEWGTLCALGFILLAVFLIALSGAARAICTPIAQRDTIPTVTLANWSGGSPFVRPAALSDAVPKPGTVELTYLGHSSFLIRTPGGVSAITDYNDGIVMPLVPTIATMNIAHETHYSMAPDPGIKHVLHGWKEGGTAQIDLKVGDMGVRNVPTNIRSYGGMMGGNSIFIFETAGLCIAHLGHLHQTLTKTHLAALGVIDVLLVPIDGTYTLAQDQMALVVKQINPSLVIPMHVFNPYTLQNFLGYLADTYKIGQTDGPTVILARNTLPYHQVMVLPPY